MSTTTIIRYELDPHLVYPIDEVARITHVPRHTIAVYCRWGLITPAQDPDSSGWFFNDEAIRAVQRAEYLHRERGVNLEGVRLIFRLMEELEALRQEVRFQRGP